MFAAGGTGDSFISPAGVASLTLGKVFIPLKIFVKYLRDKHKLTWSGYCFHNIKDMKWNPKKIKVMSAVLNIIIVVII